VAVYASARKSLTHVVMLDSRQAHAGFEPGDMGTRTMRIQLHGPASGHVEANAWMGPSSDMIDACLVRQAQAGDQQAIADLLRLTRPIAERAVVRQFGDDQAADDLAQASLLVVLTGLRSLRAPEAYVAWVQGIARNICRKEVRHKESVREAATRLAQHNITAPTSMMDPLEEAIRLEVRAHLEHALGCLQWRYRVVVIMRAVEGHSYDEIGAALDVPTHLARLWYFRARRHLQETCNSDDVLVQAPSRSSSECVVEFPHNRVGRAEHRPPVLPAAVAISSSAASS
jgi:RNA polymerase sigma factor (sigma-70 family)